MRMFLRIVLLGLILSLFISSTFVSAKEVIGFPIGLKFAAENREKAVTPIASRYHMISISGSGKYAIIHYVPDDDYNYYHTDYVSEILRNKEYSVIIWNAGNNKCRNSECTNYFLRALNRDIRVIYYYGHTAKNDKKEIWGLIMDDIYGITTDIYAGNFKAVGANLNGALIFVLGCDSYKLRQGFKKYYSVTYVGTKGQIALIYIKSKGKKFWDELSKGKTAKQAVDAIQPHWWEFRCPEFGLDGDSSWKL
ncbi:hypothetical protein P8X24_03610 [Pyrococcus kukulkanii]|uniref:hypothetical protein n=1 Tax=Pyrococcus kukulkanii TaxID=1609559 RepID=UPI003567B370